MHALDEGRERIGVHQDRYVGFWNAIDRLLTAQSVMLAGKS